MRVFLSCIALSAAVLAGCSSDKSPEMNWLSLASGVTSTTSSSSTTSTSPSAGHLTFNESISHDDADRANTSVEADIAYDGKKGMKLDEGTADLVLVRPFFDDGDSFNAWNRLAGDLHVANSAPDIADFQVLQGETRRFVLVGKKAGHADLSFTIDGTPGTVIVPVDIVIPTTTH